MPVSPENNAVLNAVEVRVLGALVEKEKTTPDYYPLSLNALTNACNQLSNREPVVSYDDGAVLRAVEALRVKKLAFVFHGADSRVPKYGHKFAEMLGTTPAETAVLCVLMLRGPQTIGEVRGRTGRMHEFASLADVETTLQGLATHAHQPLVVKLPRQAGFKESRYAHLLAGPPEAMAPETPASPETSPAPLTPDRERLAKLETDTAALRREVDEMRQQLTALRRLLE
ncbi:MAG: YceH family protein [Opitutaceae bacterium]|nr:YceH family protein [Opitutaceae bacterium]